MVTLLEECTNEEQRSVNAFFFLAKALNAEDIHIHKEMFPVYFGKCLSRKAVHDWVENISLMMKRLKRRCENG
jgi:hypothetical protein